MQCNEMKIIFYIKGLLAALNLYLIFYCLFLDIWIKFAPDFVLKVNLW